jgi:hypothetical protein
MLEASIGEMHVRASMRAVLGGSGAISLLHAAVASAEAQELAQMRAAVHPVP